MATQNYYQEEQITIATVYYTTYYIHSYIYIAKMLKGIVDAAIVSQSVTRCRTEPCTA